MPRLFTLTFSRHAPPFRHRPWERPIGHRHIVYAQSTQVNLRLGRISHLPCSSSGTGHHAPKNNTKQLCPLRAVRNGQYSTKIRWTGLCRFYLFLTHLLRPAPLFFDLPSSHRNTEKSKTHQGMPLRNSGELTLISQVIQATACARNRSP